MVTRDMAASSSVTGNIAGFGSTQINAPVTIGGPRSRDDKFKDLRDKLLAQVGPSLVSSDIADGTCEWILSNSVFKDWLRSPSKHLLRICGGPGKGKTHLATFLCDELARNTQSSQSLVLKFFCQHSDIRRNSSLAVHLGLLYQILVSNKADADLHNDVSSILHDQHTDLNSNLPRDEFWQTIKGFINHYSTRETTGQVQRRIYFILDGLDECDNESIRDLTRKLERLCSVENREASGYFKAIVLSRPLASSKKTGLLINLDDDVIYHQQIQTEIRLFIDWKMRTIFEGREDELESLKDILTKRSNQTFLWVSLALKLLETHGADLQEIIRDRPSEALDRLLPAGLSSMYNRILLEVLRGKYLGRPNSRPVDTAKIIRYICLAFVPLTKDQLQAVAGDRSGFHDSIRCCRHLLSGDTKDGTLQLVHLSLKEYLQPKPYSAIPASWGHRLWPALSSLVDILRASVYRVYFIDHLLFLALLFRCRQLIISYPAVSILATGLTAFCLPGVWKLGSSVVLQRLLRMAQTLLDLCVLGIFVVPENETHRELFLDSFNHLMDEETGLRPEEDSNLARPGALSDKKPQSVDNTLSQFGHYASRFWAEHFCSLFDSESGDKGEMTDEKDESSVLEFLEKNFLHWLRNLALQGKLSDGIQSIRQLAELFRGREDRPSGLDRWLNDAERFTLRFASIIERAPFQIYGTALLFAPKESAVRQSLWSQVLPFVKDVSGVPNNWGPCLQVLEGHRAYVKAVAFSPDGKTIASASEDGTVRLWDTATGGQRKAINVLGTWCENVFFSSDGNTVAVDSSPDVLSFWDTESGDLVHEIHLGDGVTFQGLSPKGDFIACMTIANETAEILLFDQKHARPTEIGPAKVLCQVGDITKVGLAFSPDGRLLASALGTVKIWDIATGALVSSPETHTELERPVAFSPDGNLMASATSEGTVLVRDKDKDRDEDTWRLRWEGHERPASCLAFSPDNSVIASGAYDNTIQLWDSEDGHATNKLRGHTDFVSKVAFSPAGRILASGSLDGTVRLWDPVIRSSEPVVASKDNVGYATSVVFSPESDAVALSLISGGLTLTKIWSPATRSSQILIDRSLELFSGVFSPQRWTFCHSVKRQHRQTLEYHRREADPYDQHRSVPR